jgi:hypothetical protein
MTDVDYRASDPDDFPEQPPPDGEVNSAARSCSAIIIIVAAIGLILCVSLAIAQFG